MKKTLLILFAFILFINANSQSLTQQWATGFAGTGENSDKFNALIRDVSGNIYAVGYTWRSGNGKDFLLVKFNATGDTLWTRTYDGTGNGNDELNDLTFDNTGNVIVTGNSKTTTGKDITTAKYNTAGDLLWLSSFNNFSYLDDYGVKVVADNAGNVYAGGYGYNSNLNNDYIVVKYSSTGVQSGIGTFNGADGLDDVLVDMAIDGSGNIVVTGKSKTASNKDDYATVKYNSGLTQQWVKTVDQAGKNDRATGVWIDAANDVYITGRSSNGGDYDYLTIKYLGANGNTGWAQPKIFDSSGDDIATDIVGSANEVVVTGTKFNGIQTDIQTIAYNPSTGAQIWSAAYANANGKDESANHISIGPSDAVVVTGTTNISANTSSNNDLLLLKYNSAGAEQFVKIIGGGSNLDDNGSASLVDGSGNIYTVGALVNNSSAKDAVMIEHNTGGILQFNKAYNGEGEFTDKAIALCSSSGFVYSTGYSYVYGQDRNFCTIKYDAAGNKVWVKIFNGPGSDTDEPRAISADGSGNIYVAGRSKNANGDYDMFIIKYNAIGDTIWTKNYDGGVAGDDEVNDMAVDGNGNVYVTGSSDGDPSLLVNSDYLTVKYSSAGALLWATPYNGNGGADDKAYSVALDNSGNAYVTGRTWNGTDYDIQTNKYASANGAETVFATYASNLGDDVPVKIKLDNGGNVIVGATSDRDATASTNRDYLVIQYNSSGIQQWAQLYNGIGTGDDDLKDLTVDATGNVFATGSSDLDSTITDNLDYVTIKYNSAGAKLWSVNYNGTANATDVANAVTFDSNGNVYVTGQSDEGSSSIKNNNAVTIMYSSSGSELVRASISCSVNTSDAGNDILFENGSIYITGYGTYFSADQKDFLTVKYDVTTGIKNLADNTALIIYPNPCSANSQFRILFSDETEMIIYNSFGELVASQKLLPNSTFSTNNWSAGMYFVQLKSTTGLKTVKLIIQ